MPLLAQLQLAADAVTTAGDQGASETSNAEHARLKAHLDGTQAALIQYLEKPYSPDTSFLSWFAKASAMKESSHGAVLAHCIGVDLLALSDVFTASLAKVGESNQAILASNLRQEGLLRELVQLHKGQHC